MKIKVDNILRSENLGGATPEKPAVVKVMDLKVVLASDLGFASDEDRYELSLDLNGEKYTWLPNKTSLKVIVTLYGDESDNWKGKELKLYSVLQNVSGQMKNVIYVKL